MMRIFSYQIKRALLVRLPPGDDLLAAITAVVEREQVMPAVFSVIGAVTNASFGYYDQRQRIYKTLQRDGRFEIISCNGNCSLKDASILVHAHILFGDEQGACCGGHLMSPTTICAAEMHLLELDGPAPERVYDETTGLFLWR
jgi:hypothetical protein